VKALGVAGLEQTQPRRLVRNEPLHLRLKSREAGAKFAGHIVLQIGRVYCSCSLIFLEPDLPAIHISNEVAKMLARAAGFATLALLITSANAQELTVYTALEADQIKAYQASFEKSNPGIKIRWVRDSTGVVTAKLLAEKADPKADVVFGLAATSLMLLDKEGMLQAYTPVGLDRIKQSMRDPANPPKWVGMDIWASAICFNTVEAAKKNIPIPKTWADLAKPEYKGQIAMPNRPLRAPAT